MPLLPSSRFRWDARPCATLSITACKFFKARWSRNNHLCSQSTVTVTHRKAQPQSGAERIARRGELWLVPDRGKWWNSGEYSLVIGFLFTIIAGILMISLWYPYDIPMIGKSSAIMGSLHRDSHGDSLQRDEPLWCTSLPKSANYSHSFAKHDLPVDRVGYSFLRQTLI